MTQITKMVWSYLEPDILECEVKWALGSITTNKASGGDGILAEPFQILKDDAVHNNKVHNKCNALDSSQNYPPDPRPWKTCLPRNRSLVPKRLGTPLFYRLQRDL